MPRNLPNALLEAKNQVESTAPWLLLIDVHIPLTPELTLYVVNNNENITFNGQVYTAYPFSISLPTQTSKGEVSKTTLTVYDVDKTLRGYLDDLDGGYGTTVTLRLVNTECLASDYADLTLYFDLLDATIEGTAISMSLGAPNMMRQAFPAGRYMANHCMWGTRYGGVECKLPLAGNGGLNRTAFPTCDGTRASCTTRGNTKNYGGHPGLSDSSLRIA